MTTISAFVSRRQILKHFICVRKCTSGTLTIWISNSPENSQDFSINNFRIKTTSPVATTGLCSSVPRATIFDKIFQMTIILNETAQSLLINWLCHHSKNHKLSLVCLYLHHGRKTSPLLHAGSYNYTITKS